MPVLVLLLQSVLLFVEMARLLHQKHVMTVLKMMGWVAIQLVMGLFQDILVSEEVQLPPLHVMPLVGMEFLLRLKLAMTAIPILGMDVAHSVK